jgi:hypothetical protein
LAWLTKPKVRLGLVKPNLTSAWLDQAESKVWLGCHMIMKFHLKISAQLRQKNYEISENFWCSYAKIIILKFYLKISAQLVYFFIF